jgi:hypothetical protein
MLFNPLLEKMGAEYKQYNLTQTWKYFDPLGLYGELIKIGEAEVPLGVWTDTKQGDVLEYLGKPVLVYIRDQRYGCNYKFHIANCRTLIAAQQSQRYDRYVMSINTNGIFKVNKLYENSRYSQEKELELKLDVCKNCLLELNYKGYRNVNYLERKNIFENFSIKEYFQDCEKQNIVNPRYTNLTSPTNQYTPDWTTIANDLKENRRYTCEECCRNLLNDKRFLQVHHINGLKHDNSQENLKVLCIECHANCPAHAHIKNNPLYNEYLRKYGQSGTLFSL